jgi:hypothetical protein
MSFYSSRLRRGVCFVAFLGHIAEDMPCEKRRAYAPSRSAFITKVILIQALNQIPGTYRMIAVGIPCSGYAGNTGFSRIRRGTVRRAPAPAYHLLNSCFGNYPPLFNLMPAVGTDAGVQAFEMPRLEGGEGFIDKVIQPSRLNAWARKR